MKAIIVHQYGAPEVLKYESAPLPNLSDGQVLIQVVATSVNPFDIKQRSGLYKDYAPLKFPAILGIDVSGVVSKIGPGVNHWQVGDRVFAQATKTYAEFCAVKATQLAKVPPGLDLVEAAALPTVLTTGNTLVTKGIDIHPGQTILVTGATGNVGRAAVYAAKERGAVVIAGVRKKYLDEAITIGADKALAIDNDEDFSKIPMVDAVADTIGGAIAEKLMTKIKKGGIFGSVVGGSANTKNFPDIKVVAVYGSPDAKILSSMTEAVINGKLQMPKTDKFPLKDASFAHAAVEKGIVGKAILVVATDLKY